MIIDMRTQPDAWRLDTESNRRPESPNCADGAVVVAFRSDRLGLGTPTESIAALVADFPDRLVGFAGIDPASDSALEDIAQAAELGMAGVAISPADAGCRATSDSCMLVFERAASRELPVMVANPALRDPRSVAEFARPETLDEAAGSIPGLTLILGDLGHCWLDESLLLLERHPRVFAEISTIVDRPWSLVAALQKAHERNVLAKLLFASDSPKTTPEQAVERLYTVNSMRAGSALPSIPRESLRKIVERDGLAAIGVDHLIGKRTDAEIPAVSTRLGAQGRHRENGAGAHSAR